MYKIGTAEDLWYCREKFPEIFLKIFEQNSLKPLGHATVCRHIELCLDGLSSPLNILEIGHGSFSPTFEIFKNAESVNLFGIDDHDADKTVSNTALTNLRNNYKNATFFSGYVGVNTPTELPSKFFDLVYSVSVIEHIPVEDQVIFHSELRRIIKPGGIQIHSYDRPWGGDIQMMKNAIDAAGFEWVEAPVTDDFWKLDTKKLVRVVFEHPFNVMERFMHKQARQNRKLYNWATVVIKARRTE